MRFPRNKPFGSKCSFVLALLFAVLLLSHSPLLAQDDWNPEDETEVSEKSPSEPMEAGNNDVRTVDVEPSIHEVQVLGGTIFIDFTIPYDGIVELKLLNSDGKRVYHSHFIRNKGNNQIKLQPRLHTEKKETYTYYFQYKGFTRTSSFSYP